MGVIISILKTSKEFVMKKICVVSSPEDTEINWIQTYHNQWAERIKQAYADDFNQLLTRLAKVEDARQKRLQAAPAVVKRRAVKIQHKAEREADPVKMEKYLAKCEKLRDWRWNNLANYSYSEQVQRNAKRNAFRVTTPRRV
jgi:hypothetical protein